MRLTKLSAAIACVLAALIAAPAAAATYSVPVWLEGEANGTIFKITVKNGTIKRAGEENGVQYYEADMDGNSCSTTVTVIWSETDIDPTTVSYDVCSEEGFSISIGRN